MFCYQCQQTACNISCSGKGGVCGKTAHVSDLQDALTGALIGLAVAVQAKSTTAKANRLMVDGLFTTVTNVSFGDEAITVMLEGVRAEKEAIATNIADYDMANLWEDNEDIRSLKSLILFGTRGIAAYAYHGMVMGYWDDEIISFLFEAMAALAQLSTMEELLPLVLKTGEINLKTMALLDQANTEKYGVPTPTSVSMTVEKGPFIVVSGHDLHDLELLLQQSAGKGVNVYTHSEMLPAHSYPNLKQYTHLKGNFGTAWQNQQSEFRNLPGAVLFTTNCLMPVGPSYKDRVFTTAVVSYPEVVHIGEDKDFSPVIEKALALGGYDTDQAMTGINGGATVTTGFGHGTILSVADKVVNLVKTGKISHFFLVGGCDGSAPGRNYYTEFVKQTPTDSIVLTLACGKYRFNDLDLGDIDGLPRIMDMGQCNDAFGAIKVAVALAEAFGCGVNELPLTLNISWFEQKAVSILLTLLHLGLKNIYLGPTLPAFVSSNILNFLVENYQISPISTPEIDLAKMLKQ